MTTDLIKAELAAISATDFNLGDVAERLARSTRLFDHIVSIPDFRDGFADSYFLAAAAQINLLSAANRYYDLVEFVEPMIQQLQTLEDLNIRSESISDFCAAMGRAACCAAGAGERTVALEYLHEVSVLLESLDDQESRVALLIATSVVYGLLGAAEDNAEATKYARRAAILSERFASKYIPSTLCNLIHFSNVECKYDESLRIADQLKAYFDGYEGEPHFTEDFYIGRVYFNMFTNVGDAWLGKGDLDQAEYHFTQGIELADELELEFRGRVSQYEGLGRVEMARGNYDAAIVHYRSAVRFGEVSAQRVKVKDCYRLLSEAFEAKGDYATALSYAKGYHEQNQKLVRESMPVSHANLEAKYKLAASIEQNERLEIANANEKRLNQALARKNDELTMYTNIMSHDVRSPLFIIRMCADLIKESPTSEEQVKVQSEFISQAARSIGELMDDLVLYSKADADVASELAIVDLNVTVEEVVAAMHQRIDDAGAELTIGDLPRVLGEKSLLAALFRNLISNAITYQPTNAPDHVAKLEISTRSTGAGDYEIRITDNGIGIPDEFVGELFEPFTRCHIDEYDGTGLGMAICQRVVQIHDAEIELERSSEEGSCFKLSFPKVDNPHPPKPVRDSRVVNNAQEVPKKSPRR